MKKSLIYIAAGIAAVGFAVPAFAAHGDTPEHIVPSQTPVSQVTVASIPNTITTTPTSNSQSIDNAPPRTPWRTSAVRATRPSTPTIPRCTGVAVASTDDNATTNSVDDNATSNSVEDISGPCDEAEHANDPRCTGATASAGADDSGHDVNDDNSGRRQRRFGPRQRRFGPRRQRRLTSPSHTDSPHDGAGGAIASSAPFACSAR